VNVSAADDTAAVVDWNREAAAGHMLLVEEAAIWPGWSFSGSSFVGASKGEFLLLGRLVDWKAEIDHTFLERNSSLLLEISHLMYDSLQRKTLIHSRCCCFGPDEVRDAWGQLLHHL